MSGALQQELPGIIAPPAAGSAAELLEKVRKDWAPPPELTVSEFADSELIVPTGRLAGTRWRTDYAPYQRGIMDAFEEAAVEHVVVMTSAQVGKTSVALATIAYHIVHDPCPILVVQPTERPMAKDFSKNRLEPLIRTTPSLRERVSRRRQKGGSSTTYLKTFRGGMLALAGANSASSLAARPVRVLLLDEIDRYPPELKGEGDTISVAMARTKTYRGRRRIGMYSTPTERDAPIDTWFRRGDQRRFFVPCSECGAMEPYRWENVKWDKDADGVGDPETARIHCPHCDHGMDDVERIEQLQHGEWLATSKPERPGLISFHLWEAYSPWSSLSEIVSSFIEARKRQKAGDPREMHSWQNTTLGEPVEYQEGEGVEPEPLLMRREEYPAPVPAGACLLTMGVDVQDDRLEALVIGWGPGEESWFVDRRDMWGDTTQAGPWEKLDELVSQEYLHESGQRLTIAATGLDTAGHRTDIAYEYCRRQAANRVYACIGRDGDRPIVSAPSKPRRGQGGRKVPLYTVGVDAAKALFMSRLRVTEKGPGYVHFAQADWVDEELVAQLTSERLKTTWRSGRPKTRWVKTRTRNEMLDCAVLAIWALRRLRPDLELLHERLYNPDAEARDKAIPRSQPKRRSWLERRPGGWMKRRQDGRWSRGGDRRS